MWHNFLNDNLFDQISLSKSEKTLKLQWNGSFRSSLFSVMWWDDEVEMSKLDLKCILWKCEQTIIVFEIQTTHKLTQVQFYMMGPIS